LQNHKKKKMNRKWLVIGAAGFLLLVVIGGSVLWLQKDMTNAQQEDTPVVSEALAEADAKEQFVLETDGVQINTQYVSMYYPNEYASDVMINVEEEADQSVVNVFVTFDGKDGELFSIIFDTSEGDGFKIGSLKYEDKEVGIFVRMNEWDTENWPVEEVTHLSRLQESVNILIQQLHETPGFVLS